jgi:hypothetical protein
VLLRVTTIRAVPAGTVPYQALVPACPGSVVGVTGLVLVRPRFAPSLFSNVAVSVMEPPPDLSWPLTATSSSNGWPLALRELTLSVWAAVSVLVTASPGVEVADTADVQQSGIARAEPGAGPGEGVVPREDVVPSADVVVTASPFGLAIRLAFNAGVITAVAGQGTFHVWLVVTVVAAPPQVAATTPPVTAVAVAAIATTAAAAVHRVLSGRCTLLIYVGIGGTVR